MSFSPYIPESVMVIVAHPDDIEFGCAGTVARWTKAGARACYVLCTSGDVGIAEPDMTRERAMEIREAEQREAARIAGVDEVVFLRHPDGMLVNTLDLRKELVREIRRFRPEVVITGDPTIVWAGDTYINHPDHRAASGAALDAVFPAAGQPNLFEDLGLPAHKVRKVYVTSWGEVNTWVSIDDTLETKTQALLAHKSQVKPTVGERIRQWAAERAKGKEMQYAEAFRVITLVSDDDWEKRRNSA